jgi:hypothetical protein
MQIKEGSFLSFLGLIELDSETGNLQMSKLISVVAGGLTHAMKYVKK